MKCRVGARLVVRSLLFTHSSPLGNWPFLVVVFGWGFVGWGWGCLGVAGRSPVVKGLTSDEAADQVLSLCQDGHSYADALRAVGRSKDWLRSLRKRDSAFNAKLLVASSKGSKAFEGTRAERAGSFTEFRETFLGAKTFPHQQNWVDVLEGGEPSWMHDSFVWEKRDPQLLLFNVPPAHSKSTVLTVDYVTYRICLDPNIRVLIVSKTQGFAKKFLFQIKQRLDSPRFKDLQIAFGPEGGFRAKAETWAKDSITLGTDARDSDQKDPTVQALGIQGQIYGARADLIIIDDAVVINNAAQWEGQMDWLRQEVQSRLEGDIAKLLVVGTRVAPQDLYRELRNPDHYTDGESPWTYFSMPAVLENESDDADEWKVLWPRSDRPFEGSTEEPDEDGLFSRWNGPRLRKIRNSIGPKKWPLVYQQMDMAEDAIFDPLAVRACVNAVRPKGPLRAGQTGFPASTDGFWFVCSMDPAMTQDTAAIAYAVDRETKKRYVLDCTIETNPSPAKIRDIIFNWTDLYGPQEWVIEKNAFQIFLTADEQINHFLASKGCKMVPHYTSSQRVDPEFGIASMAPLFGTMEKVSPKSTQVKHSGNNLIELPTTHNNESLAKLCEQLIVWDVNVKPKYRKQDAVMALWFAELRAREMLERGYSNDSFFMDGMFTSGRDRSTRGVIDLNEWQQKIDQEAALEAANQMGRVRI